MQMDCKIVKTHDEHFNLIDFRNEEVEAFACDPTFRQRFFALTDAGQTGTVLCGGRILCIMGLYPLWPGVWECFVFPSKYIHDHPKTYLKFVKTYLHQMIESFGMRRLQTVSLANTETNKWMEFLGFNFEGLHRKYSPDNKDYSSWSIVI